MDYQEARPRIRSGDLIAQSHREWKSWHDIKVQIVRFFTQSEYSHVGIAWVVGGRVFMLEAVQPKVRIYPMAKIGDFYWLPMKAQWKDATERIALEHVGDDYSQALAVQAFFSDIDHSTTNECAAYVRHVLESDEIFLGNRATPDAIVREAQKRGAEMYYVIGDSQT